MDLGRLSPFPPRLYDLMEQPHLRDRCLLALSCLTPLRPSRVDHKIRVSSGMSDSFKGKVFGVPRPIRPAPEGAPRHEWTALPVPRFFSHLSNAIGFLLSWKSFFTEPDFRVMILYEKSLLSKVSAEFQTVIIIVAGAPDRLTLYLPRLCFFPSMSSSRFSAGNPLANDLMMIPPLCASTRAVKLKKANQNNPDNCPYMASIDSGAFPLAPQFRCHEGTRKFSLWFFSTQHLQKITPFPAHFMQYCIWDLKYTSPKELSRNPCKRSRMQSEVASPQWRIPDPPDHYGHMNSPAPFAMESRESFYRIFFWGTRVLYLAERGFFRIECPFFKSLLSPTAFVLFWRTTCR